MGYEHATTQKIWEYLSDHIVSPQWTFKTYPQEIEMRLWEWQHLHYNQAHETPMTIESCNKLHPNDKTDDEIENIMTGQIFSQAHDLSNESKTFFKYLTSNIQPRTPEQKEINKKFVQSFYKGARESTSSSPPKLHLGH